jgi:Ca2+-binding EF-hand superfamily protein
MKNRKRNIIIIAAAGAALLAASGAVYAHGDRGKGGFHRGHRAAMESMIERLDANKDGAITREETTARRDKSLATYDADGNKTLSIKEFEGLWAEITRPRMVRAFQRLDRDGDGQVTADELDRPLARMFARLVRDGDGKVTAEEMRSRGGYGEHRRSRHGDREGGHRGPRGGDSDSR